MSLSCPVDLDVLMLRREVTAMYGSVAAAPDGRFHFHRGPEYAARTLGYDADALSRLPIDVTARFAGMAIRTPSPHCRLARLSSMSVVAPTPICC